MLRVFIGISLPISLRHQLHQAAHCLKIAGRIIPERNIHLTLKFMGKIDEKKLSQIKNIINEVAVATIPFKIKLEGLGAFPSVRRPRVIWTGLKEGSESLREIVRKLDEGFNEPFDEEKFSPHITIIRMKKPVDVSEKLKIWGGEKFDSAKVSKITLFESRLSGEGPEYHILYEQIIG